MKRVKNVGRIAPFVVGLWATAGGIGGVTGGALGAEAAAVTAADLVAMYPGLHTVEWGGHVQVFYGMPMNQAATADDAAAAWLAQYQTAFGAGHLDLELMWAPEDIENGKFTVFTYGQSIDGIPVEFSVVKILVLNTLQSPTVVLASAKVAPVPQGGLGQTALTGEQAMAKVQEIAEYRGLPVWGQPEMIVYQGEGDFANWITPTVVWKFTGEMPNGAMSRKYSFLVDASNGNLIFARNEILNVNVTGSVHARATPSNLGNAAADNPTNPLADRVVPNIRVRINGNNANSVYTDANGNFNIPWTLTAPVTVDCSVGDGNWVTIQEQNAGQSLLTASATVTPGTPVQLNLNPASPPPTSVEFSDAEINAFVAQNATHNFIKQYAPSFTALDTQLPAKPGTSGTCNAFYDGTATNFYNVGGGCNNTAFSSVVSHEYGHHIVNRRNLAQNGFGEGFGDTMSILLYDDQVVGRYFFQTGGPVRTPATDGVQYPCTGCEVHQAGEVLGGVICNALTAFKNKYGNTPGLEKARQTHINWYLITVGGTAPDSATPTTLAEYLTANDDDGNINNGTPDMCEIAAAFAAHGITNSGVATNTVGFSLSTPPTTMAPGQVVPYNLAISAGCRTPVPLTARLYRRAGTSGAFTQVIPTPGTTNHYSGNLTGPACSSGVLQYYFSVNTNNANGTSAGLVYYPADSNNVPQPISVITATATGTFADDFETDRGWTTGPNTATTGLWVRAVPVASPGAQTGTDHSPSGTMCWVTGNAVAGAAEGTQDVDGGLVTLNSPVFNMSAYSEVTVSYWRWYSNGLGAAPNADTFRVDVSTNNGSTWTNAETVGPGPNADTTPGWRFASWNFSTLHLTPTSQVKIRFIAEDAGAGSVIEAALDDFTIVGTACVDAPPCPADFNNDGGIDGQDVEAFFSAWQSGDPSADVNNDGGVDGADVETFFIAWQNGGC